MTIRSIRTRIALLTGCLLALIFVGFGSFIYISLARQLYRSMDDGLRIRADELLAAATEVDGEWQFNTDDIGTTLATGVDTVIRLVSPTGSALFDNSLHQVPIPAQTVASDGGIYTIRYNDSIAEEKVNTAGETDDFIRLLSVPLTPAGETIAYLQVGRDLESIHNTLRRLLVLLAVSGPVVVIVGSVAGYWLAGMTLAPIDVMQRRAASISAQDLSARIDVPLPDDEVGRLARTFNDMLSRLDASFRRQRQFTADASHELRTPLAVIRGEVDVTLERARSVAEYERALRSIGAETDWMTRLVSDLLLLARSDAAELKLERHQIDLVQLLDAIIEQLQTQTEAVGMQWQVDMPISLYIQADPDRLLQLFTNILTNAMLHAPGSQITLTVKSDGDSVEVTVADTGPGIASEHLPHLFERFYRVDKARSRTVGGSGLGLAIAEEIVRAHTGTIHVESEVGVGTAFRVRLPSTG